jgi:hypothetical protein
VLLSFIILFWFTMVLLPGVVSSCGHAIVGHRGHMFLFRGSNCLHDQYFNPAPCVDRWMDIILNRASLCNSEAIDFYQIIIPEKQTIMVDLYPLEKPVMTPSLLSLNSRLSSLPFFVNAYDLLSCLYFFKGLEPFRLGDTHLTSAGYIELISSIVGRYCQKTLYSLMRYVDFCFMKSNGDLLKKFDNNDFGEKVTIPADSSLFFCGKVRCAEYMHGSAAKKNGTMVKFENSCPHIAKKVLVFGNSMSERGASPLGLTWWLSRIFQEVTFIWSPNLSLERIAIDRPDILICQTVERFLPVAAKA